MRTDNPAPICLGCTRYRPGIVDTCEAFPRMIPKPIWENKKDHRVPYPGDQGMKFIPKTDDDMLAATLIFS